MCPEGFVLGPDWKNCDDVDECAAGDNHDNENQNHDNHNHNTHDNYNHDKHNNHDNHNHKVGRCLARYSPRAEANNTIPCNTIRYYAMT